MYLQHYGFRDKPFKLTHDPAYYFGEAHQVPLNELCYSIEERHGLAILLGEPGTGKTTLLLRLLRSFSRQLTGVFLSDIAVGEASLIRQVGRALLLPFKPQDPTETVAQYLDIFLRGQVNAGKTVVVLIDEAQGLTDGQFEELRHLTNLEHKGRKLVEIVLAGLPSLERKFRTPDLESLSQRVRQLVAEQRLNVVVNVQGLSVIDSSGVGELVASFSTLKRAGGALKVAGPTKLVQDVLRIARIPTIIEVYDTEEAAVNAFSA